MKKIGIIITLAFFLFSCHSEKQEQAENLRPVKYMTLGENVLNGERSFGGTVKAIDEIELSFRASGIITELNVKVGQKIKKGELLARLDNVQAKLSFEQAVSAFNTAKSAYNTSKSQLDRVRLLYEKGSNSLSDYEQAKNAFTTNSDQYESAKRNIEIKQSQIDNGIIYAPANGVIATKNANLNETTNAGQPIAVLNAGQSLNVEIGLPESLINEVKIGMETSISFSAIPGESFSGRVIEIAPVPDPASSTYRIKVGIDQNSPLIKYGMSASVAFNFNNSGATETILVPINTVSEDGNGNFVFVIHPSDKTTGTVKKQQIVLGKLTNNGFEVKRGLQKGDKVVTAGTNSLLDGQKVKF